MSAGPPPRGSVARLLGIFRPALAAPSELERLTAPLGLTVAGERAKGSFGGREVEVRQGFEEIRAYLYAEMSHHGDVKALAASLASEPLVHRKTALLLAATGQARDDVFALTELTLTSAQRVLCRAPYVHETQDLRKLLEALVRTCEALERSS